jgi:hypothetical protein
MNEPGLPGTPAPHVKIQYSVDGVTNWHDAPTSEDKYFRMSTDDGATWGGAVYCGNTADAEIARIAAEAARDKAAQWAENPEDVEVEAGQYSALHHKEKALDAQVAAAASATAASTSEGNALASENKAHKWAENPEDVEVETGQYSALHHKEKALDAQVAADAARDKAAQWAENPEDVEVEAGQYSALHHKEKALDAQAAAAASATAASTSEGNALASENKAHQWAEEAEDIEVQTGEYSAYHWAKKAENYAPLIEDQIVDGVTDKSPSQNAVYDALATKIGSVSEDTTPELGGELDAGEHTIGFTERSNTSSAGAVTIDWTKSNHQSITLTEDTTFTFTAPSNPCNLTLRIIQDATGGWNVTFPTFKTPSGVNLSFTTTAGAEDLLMLYFDGTNYIAGILADVQ